MAGSIFRMRRFDRLLYASALLALVAGGILARSPPYGRALGVEHGTAARPPLARLGGDAQAFLRDSLGLAFDRLLAREPSGFVRANALVVGDTAELSEAFQRMGYSLGDTVEGGIAVPRVVVSTLPPDFAAPGEVDQRKALFFQLLLPLVLQVNEGITEQRHRLVAMRERMRRGAGPTPGERQWLVEIAAYYNGDADKLDDLLRRVDAIPPSLALAQAAIESGWGTSRVALKGNALFGQYTTDETSALQHSAMRQGMDFHIRAFGGLLEAVESYARNLNTHQAYKAFRVQREKARELGEDLDGYRLAGWIGRYSSRGEHYVRDVRRVIRANELDGFDRAWLAEGNATHLVSNDA